MQLFASASGPVVEWHPHVDVWIAIISLVAGYAAAIRWLGPSRTDPGKPPATARQMLLFMAGVLVLWAGADWPVHDISENYLFSVHMVQHTLFSLVAPPLLLMGTPPWLLRTVLRRARVDRAVRFITRPLPALILFNAVIAVTHWPKIVDLTLQVHGLHLFVHIVLLGSAVAMWWPVVTPLSEWGSLTEPAKMLYLFLQSVLPTVPASFLTFASEPLYQFYASVPRLWGISAVTDQRIAGLTMKIGGGLLLWSVIAVIFFKWHAKEEREQEDELSWDDFERELQAWDLRR